MTERLEGWHFAAETLRDDSPLPKAGVELPRIADIEPCARGYHMSVRPIDALNYAPGPYVARVALIGDTIGHGDPEDKRVGHVRVGLVDYVDASGALREFAKACALDVIHLWEAPDVVRRYLETGDESIRAAARDAARAAAWDATRAVARDAAWDAPRAAARDAVRAAARAVARDAAWEAAARDAARDAAWGAAWDATRAAQNTRLEEMLRRLI